MDDPPFLSEPDERPCSVGSGAHALAGYDYQIDVSVWLALDLLLANRFARSIQLEPTSQEDIEADLTESEPGRLATRVATEGYKLVVQAKRRSGDAWTVAGVRALLRHGGKNRLPAARRLADPNVRYLLVTSAGLNGETRGLSVGRAGNWPKRSAMPASIVAALPPDAAGRVGIVGSLDEDRLVGDIKRLLIERFGVPFSRWDECLRKLREEARLRATRQIGEGFWQRDELAEVIRSHDGYLAASPQLENYVFPKNWQTLREAMASPKYAALIIGQSGTGKTLATSKLYEELHAEIPGLTRVPIRHGPDQLRDDQTPPPVLYDIEDPWGRYDFDPSSRPWNDQLGHYLAHATHDRRIVVTSRRDVGVSSGALKTVEDWLVPLEVEHYGPRERIALYRTRIDTLPRDVQVLAAHAEQRVLDTLASPLEVEKFFDALRISGRPDPKNHAAFVTAAIDRAQEESIELTVVQQIEERGDIAAAAVLWAMLKANDRLSIRAMRSLEVDLGARHSKLEKGVTPLIDFFAAARNLRLGEGDATYYHPRVEGGIATALRRASVPASLALRALVDALTDRDAADPFWGAGVAARILEAVGRVEELDVPARPSVQRAIDAWIDRQFCDPATRVSEHMRIAAAVGSSDSVGAEFARYIRHRPDHTFANLMEWSAPGHDQAWYDRMRQAGLTMTIATRFVREMLPGDRTNYGAALVADLDRMAPGLTPVYLEAAAGIVHHGYDPVVDTLAAGALKDLSGFESILDAAVLELARCDHDPDKSAREHLAYLNGVYNDEYAEHIADNDDGYTAGELLRAYVEEVRIVKGWRSLAQHRHAEVLVEDWLRSLSVSTRNIGAPSLEEVAGAYLAVQGTEHESYVWHVLREHWDEEFRDRLITRIRLGTEHVETRIAALECLVSVHPELLQQVIGELDDGGDRERAVELAIDLGILLRRRQGDGDDREAAAKNTIPLLSPALAAIATAAMSLRPSDVPVSPLPPHAAELLAATSGDRPEVRRLRILQHAVLGKIVAPDIERTLAQAEIGWEADQACGEAIEAAIALGLGEIVENGLDHMFASVVVPSLRAIGEPLPAPLPLGLLEFRNAPGKPIREALLTLLVAKPHPAHIPTLMALAHDEWSSSYRSHDEHDRFPIARQAVAALGALSGLPAEDLEKLDALGIGTSDRGLRLAIFPLISKQGGAPFQQRLLERAITPGRRFIRRAAANALLITSDYLDPRIIEMIHPSLPSTRMADVASLLTMLMGFKSTDEAVLSMCRMLAARPKRRVLILLAIWTTSGRRPELSKSLEELLPPDHPAIAWVRSGMQRVHEDQLVSDLGDPFICTEVLRWLNPDRNEG